jgi:hypothetical protein
MSVGFQYGKRLCISEDITRSSEGNEPADSCILFIDFPFQFSSQNENCGCVCVRACVTVANTHRSTDSKHTKNFF